MATRELVSMARDDAGTSLADRSGTVSGAGALTAAEWCEVKEIFAESVDIDESVRADFVRDSCSSAAVRREVESLLEADARAERAGVLSAPVSARAEITLPPVPAVIGNYTVLHEIGRGGMGVVVLAERNDHYRKHVAIKLIRSGLHGEHFRERFRAERQILARLEHPNIARLLDGGTTVDGLPYFVMEHVEGVRIDEYCRRHRLNVRQRLELFLPICSAIQYAHQNLVIHRDLKPANILVTADGVPKLLDFGVAKMLGPETETVETVTEMRMVTPDYAAPEQMAGAAVTTAADVYSLGVVLYELLTTRRPFQARSALELLHAVTEMEPERPGLVALRAAGDQTDERRATARQLRGDLDNIILMALRKDPARRYFSVRSFSDDLQRHLDGLPVTARRDTLAYRFSKFARRNKAAVSAAALLLMTLVGSIIFTTHAATVAREERARAEKNEAEARARLSDVRGIARTLLFDLYDQLLQVPGGIPARQTVTRTALRYIDVLSAEAKDDPSLQRELAAAYRRVASNTFNIEQELEFHRRAVKINRMLVARDPADAALREELGVGLADIANTYKMSGDIPSAVKSYEEAVVVAEQLRADHPQNENYAGDAADYLRWLADLHLQTGRAALASAPLSRAEAIQQSLLANAPGDANRRRNFYNTQWMLGVYYLETGDHESALERFNDALARAEDLANENPQDARVIRDLWVINRRLGIAYARSASATLAIEHLERAFGIIDRLASADPADLGHLHGKALTQFALADAYRNAGDAPRAREHYAAAVVLIRSVSSADPAHAEFRADRELMERRASDFRG